MFRSGLHRTPVTALLVAFLRIVPVGFTWRSGECFEQDANYIKDSVAGKALRDQVLDWPLQDLDLGDEFEGVLCDH